MDLNASGEPERTALDDWIGELVERREAELRRRDERRLVEQRLREEHLREERELRDKHLSREQRLHEHHRRAERDLRDKHLLAEQDLHEELIRAEGAAQAMAQALLSALRAKELRLGKDEQARIADCLDLDLLRHWYTRAVTATTTAEVFAGPTVAQPDGTGGA